MSRASSADPTGVTGPSNVLDFALRFFACTAEDDLYRAVSEADAERLDECLQAYRAFAARGVLHAPPLGEGELRPYFPTQGTHLEAWARGGIDLDRRSLATEEKMWLAVDRLKHRLLYCHSVAVDDPLPELLSLAVAQARLGNQGHSGMDALQNYVSLLLHMRELLRNHVLCLLSSWIYVTELRAALLQKPSNLIGPDAYEQTEPAVLDTGLDEMAQVADEDVRRHWADFQRSESGRAFLRKLAFEDASRRIHLAFDAVNDTDGKVSAYLPFRFDVDLLARFTEGIPQPLQSLPDSENWLLAGLIDIDLPGIADLQPEDLVAIRMGSDEFEDWRRALREALLRAEALPRSLRDRDAGAKKLVDETLAAAKRRIEDAMPRSRTLAGVRAGSIAMLGGAVSVTLVGLINPAATLATAAAAIAGVAGSALVTAAAKACEGDAARGASLARRAAYAHYVAMLR